MSLSPQSIGTGSYSTYKSPYGPKYQFQPQVAGITSKSVVRFGLKSGAFGGVALFTLLFLGSGIPTVKRDIFQNLPLIGNNFVRDIPASDNPF